MRLATGVEGRDGEWEEERCAGHDVASGWVGKVVQLGERGADVGDPEPLLAASHGVSMGRNQAAESYVVLFQFSRLRIRHQASGQ